MTSTCYPFCLATVVTHKALTAMLEAMNESAGRGSYRDEHPWLVASEILDHASSQSLALPILFACKEEDHSIGFAYWSVIRGIEVVELHRGQWDSRCSFGALQPMNPIWEPVDSVFLKASQEQMDREAREGIRVYRTALDEHHIHPYAICETPAFILDGRVVQAD